MLFRLVFLRAYAKNENMQDMNKQIIAIKENLSKPLVLVGLMGAGKSTLGKAVAQSLGVEFIDSDNIIEKNQQQSIAEIFATHGEEYFRNKERETIANIIKTADKSIVLGTGGGAFVNEKTRELILSETLSIFIDANVDVLLERIGDSSTRPLFDGKDPRTVLQSLMNERYPVYAQSNICVPSGEETAQETIHKIITALYKYLYNYPLQA